jgi:hypothetical protein
MAGDFEHAHALRLHLAEVISPVVMAYMPDDNDCDYKALQQCRVRCHRDNGDCDAVGAGHPILPVGAW